MTQTTLGVRIGARRRRLLAATVAIGAVAAGALVGAAPAYAASSVDLTVSLTNRFDAVPGHRFTYSIVVANHGPSKASGVKIDFKTSAGLKKIRYKITSNGHCDHSPKETTCQWPGKVKAGGFVSVAITGTLSKNLVKGTLVTNSVTVRSHTKRVNKSNDRATDNYRVGVPRVSAPIVAPAPSPSPTGKLAQITNTAAKVANYTSRAVLWTFIVLGAAAVWFAIGLALHHHRRVTDADFDANDDGDD